MPFESMKQQCEYGIKVKARALKKMVQIYNENYILAVKRFTNVGSGCW